MRARRWTVYRRSTPSTDYWMERTGAMVRKQIEASKVPRRHPSGGLRRLMPWDRKGRGVSVRSFNRAILGVAQADIPKGGTGWIVLRGPTVSADPSGGPDRMVSALWEQTPDGPRLLASSAR